jgi:phosphatidylethanolamine-binding protein (PEBP) family uncharacterized protein
LQKGAGYNWTVQAQDANKKVLAELNSQFMVKASLELLEPIDGAKVGVSPTLRWAGFPGATRYQVLVIDSDAYPPEVVIDQTTTGTRWVVATPLIPGIG